MKTKLLKKVRGLHPIHFNRETKKYQYKTVNGRECLGNIWEWDYMSKWVDSPKELFDVRRNFILKDAKTFFNKSLFTYKRKRKPTIYRWC